ncbi:hypothetical protein SUGI_1197870 [Cryptomeria japonica]|nr:hypothetical protein SUGI_1197870 [Cryptomeria japonica]
MALSRIGKVYSSILKNKKGAHRYHFECTKIALAIMNPRIANSEWNKYSSMEVQKHQKEIVDEEKREHDKKYELDADRLHETINVIKEEGVRSSESFLKFIYSVHTHPDPKKGLLGSIASTEKVRVALRKAIVSYHPDNNVQYGRDWQVLCEEITKILNCKYEIHKKA